jgi:integrase
MRRLKYAVTVHGFRSSFRDWAAERTTFAREVCEAALAHVVEDQVEAAYRRTDFFELRAKLMATWALYVTTPASDVVQLRA